MKRLNLPNLTNLHTSPALNSHPKIPRNSIFILLISPTSHMSHIPSSYIVSMLAYLLLHSHTILLSSEFGRIGRKHNQKPFFGLKSQLFNSSRLSPSIHLYIYIYIYIYIIYIHIHPILVLGKLSLTHGCILLFNLRLSSQLIDV